MERATTSAQRIINTSGQRDLALEHIDQAIRKDETDR